MSTSEPRWFREAAADLQARFPGLPISEVEITVQSLTMQYVRLVLSGPADTSIKLLSQNSNTGQALDRTTGQALDSEEFPKNSSEKFKESEMPVVWVLSEAEGAEGLTARQVAEKLKGKDEIETITKRLVRMRARGLVERADSGGYRLTAEGRSALAEE